MLTLLAALGVILDLTIRSLDACRRHLVQPVITAFLLSAVYAAVHIGHEGGLSDGLRAAFWDKKAGSSERGRSTPEDILQAELHHFAAVN
jgi:hypothetical protein